MWYCAFSWVSQECKLVQICTTGAHSHDFRKDGLRTDENEPLKSKDI